MRVVGGLAAGRELKAAPSSATRPTSDKVRGAIFDILTPYLTETTRVLDLYAGTGALGIESLSRGAAHCVFVEQSAACCAVIRANLITCGFASQGQVLRMTVSAGIQMLEEHVASTQAAPYDLIVVDPPYEDPATEDVLERLARGPLLRDQGLLVLEHARRRQIRRDYQRLAYWRTKVYGDTAVSLWQRGKDDSG